MQTISGILGKIKMTKRVWHVLGNGDKAGLFNEEPQEGKLLLCNMPPFEVTRNRVFATVMVDFKMMMALTEGSLNLDMYPWILGNRPRIWMDEPSQSSFYLKYAPNIKEFYLKVPEYCGPVGSPESATNFNCGHMAVHYAANKQKAEEIHIWGFDSLFDFNMRSITDLYLSSDRSDTNNYRLIEKWRPIWYHLFREFPDTHFFLHHDHADLKIPNPGKNLTVVVHKRSQRKKDKYTVTPEEYKNMNRQQRRAHDAQLRKGLLGL